MMTSVEDLSEETIKLYAKKHLDSINSQRKRNLEHYYRIKNTPEYIERQRLRKSHSYAVQGDSIKEKLRDKYANDEEYRKIKKTRASELYQQLHAYDVPNKRGRKKLIKAPKDENTNAANN